MKSYHYKVILQTELSHLGQNLQRFEISPLQGYIADGIELLGTKMAAVIWQEKDSVLNGHTFKSIYYNVILQSESCKGTFSNLSTTRLFCRQNLEFGTKVGTPSNLSIKRLFCSQNPSFELKMAHFQISILQVCPFLL